MPKFAAGQVVRVAKLLDKLSDRALIGMIGIVEEIDEFPGGIVNYWVGEHYMREEELEVDDQSGVYTCGRCFRPVPDGNRCPECGAFVQSYM